MTDQIDGKAVERLAAQVEALHRERTNMIATHRDSIKRLTGERDAALARAEEMQAQVERLTKERDEANERLSIATETVDNMNLSNLAALAREGAAAEGGV